MSAGTAGGDWTDLAGTEVRKRLEQRGAGPALADRLWRAHERGDDGATAAITERLNR